MLGSADVCGVGVSTGTGDIAQLAAQLVLGAAGRAGRAPRPAAAAAALGRLQGCLLLLVLLALQVLLVRLQSGTEQNHSTYWKRWVDGQTYGQIYKNEERGRNLVPQGCLFSHLFTVH